MNTNPYFAQLPSRHNRQDLAHALDLLPQLIIDATTPTPISPSTTCSYSSYSTPTSPSSPLSPSTPWNTSRHSSHSFSSQQEQHRHQLIKNNLFVQHNISSYHHKSSLFLQFMTRAQAMAFLIQILQSLQQPQSEHYHSHNYINHINHINNDDEEDEDLTGRAPCYVCGEWYLELEPRKRADRGTSKGLCVTMSLNLESEVG
ncbi:hypothetical protein BGZ81_010914 [Podila clonocystis]|nr:hypothetical protein BGZ81_010914 [Podila clonocystis]